MIEWSNVFDNLIIVIFTCNVKHLKSNHLYWFDELLEGLSWEVIVGCWQIGMGLFPFRLSCVLVSAQMTAEIDFKTWVIVYSDLFSRQWFTHCGLVRPYDNTNMGSGVMACCLVAITAMLAYHEFGSLEFTILGKCSNYQSMKWVENYTFKTNCHTSQEPVSSFCFLHHWVHCPNLLA